MVNENKPLRVLYSFPHKLGADRICHTAWQQVNGLAAAGVQVLAFPGVLHKPVPAGVQVQPTLAWGKLRISYKLLGTRRACALHDAIVARRLRSLAGQVDLVHAWPMGALRTLKAAAELGIPTVLERPNAHTRFAYEVVQKECERLGIALPPRHEHAFKPDWLEIEEQEYALATRLLCPSDFVAKTFLDRGFPAERLARHQYGYDERLFYPGPGERDPRRPFTMMFAGECAPRKGLHYALEAWHGSSAQRRGRFRIVGEFVPGYAECLSSLLSHPSVDVLGFRRDVPELLRQSDVFVLPTIEEGSALVTYEARGSGCVLLVSEASGAVCRDGIDAFVHRVGDIGTLVRQLSELYDNPRELLRLRIASLKSSGLLTWGAAGIVLRDEYQRILNSHLPAPLGSAIPISS